MLSEDDIKAFRVIVVEEIENATIDLAILKARLAVIDRILEGMP